MNQLDLTGSPHPVGATGKPLTSKQARAYDLVRSTPGGITAEQLGAHFHDHGPDGRCTWCERTGLGFLRSKGLGPLVVRRRSGLWELRDGSGTAAVQTGSQLVELPDDFFGEAA